ncbi:MAG: CoA transferase [Dehalococcoidia bacterium]|nr:CoA transferase [Dehalococcoidia bacterium]
MNPALDGVLVADLSGRMSGAWCSRLMADFGADVVAVEPPGGSKIRRLEPLDSEGRSVPAMYALANKRSVVVDPADGEQVALLQTLLERCDIVIEGDGDGALVHFGVDREALLGRAPQQVLVSLTAHGVTGGRAGRAGNDLTAWAYSGWASINGLADREPLKGSGWVASYLAGVAAYGAAVSALVYRDRGGEGQHVDVSETEALLEIFGPNLLSAAYGSGRTRRKSIDISGTFPVEVGDGHLSLTIARGERYRDALIAIGLVEEADDPKWAPLSARETPEFYALVQARLREMDRATLFESLSALRVSAGPVLRPDEVLENEQLGERGFWRQVEEWPDGPPFAGPPFLMEKTPARLRRRPPAPGEHTLDEVASGAEGTTS